MDWEKTVPIFMDTERRRRGAVFRLEQLENEVDSLEEMLEELVSARTKRESAPWLKRVFYRLVYNNRKERKLRNELERYTPHLPEMRETISALESEQTSRIRGYLQNDPYVDKQYKEASDEHSQLAHYLENLSSLHQDLGSTSSSLEPLLRTMEESPGSSTPPDELSRWRGYYAGVPRLLSYRFTGTLAERFPDTTQMMTLYIKGICDVPLCTTEQVEEFRHYLLTFASDLDDFLNGLEDRQKQAGCLMSQRVEYIVSTIRES